MFHSYASSRTPSVLMNNKSESSESKEPEAGPSAISEADLKQLKEKLTKCEAETAELKDKYIRSLAEIENTRFRMNRQIEDAKVFGIQGFCKDLLEVADVLRLAITNTDPSKDAASSASSGSTVEKEKLMAMYNGLVMTEACLLKIFNKHKLVQINPSEGEKFDPNKHQAISAIEADGEPNTVINVLQKGYLLNERVMRPALVVVSKAKPAA